MKDKLPKGWEWKTLEIVCESSSSNISQNQIQDNSGDFAIYGASGVIKKINFYHQSKPYIGIVKDGAGVGRVILLEAKTSVIGTLQYLIPRDNVDLKYLYYFLLAIDFSKYVSGSTIPHIYYKNYKNEPFLYIPISEQKQIVSVLDKTFEKIDQAITLVEENIQKLKQLNESVLDEVFGRFTNTNHLQVSKVSRKIQYGYTGNALEKGDTHYLRITDIQKQSVNWKLTPFSDISSSEIEKYRLNKGDIVFARTGATAGKSYLFNSDVKSVFASYLIRVVVNKDLISPEYLYHYFQSNKYWEQVTEKTIGAAQPNVNGQKLGEIKLPVPSLLEQQRIIAYLDQTTQKNQQLIQHYQNKLNALKNLKNSVLDTAFKGALRREKPIVKNANIHFYYMQIVGAIILANRTHNVLQGEMAIAKDMYLLDRLYGVPTQMHFENHHWGPFAPAIKQVINNTTYFIRKNYPNSNATYVDVQKEETLFKTIPSEVNAQIVEGINSLNQQLFAKISPYKRAKTKELLATVLKCMEDTQSVALSAIRNAMVNWRIEQGAFTTKAEKFSEKETDLMIQFIIKENWHVKIIP